MKYYLWTACLILTFFSAYGQKNEAIDSVVYSDAKLTDQQLALISDCTSTLPENAQLSIALIKEGNIFFYGLKHLKDSIAAIDNSGAVFEIGSVTKVFTATLLANTIIRQKNKP